ncbi:MAG: hypothetical protein ACI9SG_000686, partial [Maribacter sp.]
GDEVVPKGVPKSVGRGIFVMCPTVMQCGYADTGCSSLKRRIKE